MPSIEETHQYAVIAANGKHLNMSGEVRQDGTEGWFPTLSSAKSVLTNAENKAARIGAVADYDLVQRRVTVVYHDEESI